MASGAEILGYQGNAALGLGGDVSSISTGTDNLADFNKTLATLQQQDAVWNQMQYRQKIEDRDSTLKLLADQQNKLDIPVLDSDRPALEAKMKEIDDTFLENPDLKSNPEAYQKMQKRIRDFNGMTTSAKTRAATIAKMKLDYSNNPDSEDRQKLGSYISEQEKTPVNHLVDPYQKEQSFDLKNVILDVPATPTVKRYVGANGIHYMTTTNKPDPDDIFAAYTTAGVEGPGKNIPNQWQSYWEHAQVNPDFMSDKNLLAMNKTMERINSEQGWQKGDPRYREAVAVRNDDGTWKMNVNPHDLAIDTKLVKDYDGNPVTTVDTPSQKAAYIREQERTQRSVQGLNAAKAVTERARRNQLNSAADMNRAHAGLYNALQEKAKKEGNVLDDKHLKMLSEGAAPVSEAVSAFYNAYQNTGTIQDAAKMDPVMRKQLGVEAGWSYSELPKEDPSYKKMLGTPRYGAEGSFTGAGKLLGVDYPDRILVLRSPDGDINKTKIVGLNKAGNGKETITKIVDGNTGYVNIIQADNGYKKTDKTVQLENSSRLAIQIGQGSSAAGFDMNAFIGNKGVIGSGQPVTENSGDDTTDNLDAEDQNADGDNTDGDNEDGEDGEDIAPISSFSSSDVVRVKGKPAFVKVNGVNKKIIQVDRKTGLVKYKK